MLITDAINTIAQTDTSIIIGVFGFPKLGVVGAAIATLIARSVEALIYLWMLKVSDMPFKTKVSNLFTFDFEMIYFNRAERYFNKEEKER